MSKGIKLTPEQAAYISAVTLQRCQKTLKRDFFDIPTVVPTKDTARAWPKFVKIQEVYMGDEFGAIDIIFELNGKIYLYTVEQTADGKYCSGLDPMYEHSARELRTQKRKFKK